ncbi:MAG: ThiJ/PfpI, partial [Anaeromyxobacteraceae bacterium]|nr:ThiJ/PfpI [Anaeromyxobacteraceae bacterium]
MTKPKRVGVILSGSGYLDGSEIHEATLTLLFLDKRGAKVTAMAPDVRQMHVVDHLRGEAAGAESRNVLAEAARITRGAIVDVKSVKAEDLDALILPGGYGAAKNLCTFATEGVKLQVNPEVERLVRDVAAAGKPLGFICIAPVIAAKVLGAKKVKLTIGNDPATAAVVNALGAIHVDTPVDQIVVDEKNKVVSTPAYMLGPTIAPVAAGIERLVGAV